MRGNEIQAYLRSLNGGWVDEADTVDTWKVGDPQVEVKAIAVAWMGYELALEKAYELGCNLFIVHEPIFYHHRDNDPDILAWPECVARKAKLERLGMSVLRCHDLWDQYPHLGIPDSWGKKLGLGQPLDGDEYLRVYAGHGRTALQIARTLAGRVADLGQPGVQLVGPPERPVQRLVLGTGAITPYRKMLTRYEADLLICCDDGFMFWRDGAHAIDHGYPVLIFNHPVTEEYGMQLLADHLSKKFPEIPVHFIPEKCMYQYVTS